MIIPEQPDVARISVYAREADEDNNDYYKQIETFLTVKEPNVSVLADQLWSAIRTRVHPNNTTKVLLNKKEASPTDVLDILLRLHLEAPLLLNNTLPEILNAVGIMGENPMSYCGTYVGGFVSGREGSTLGCPLATRFVSRRYAQDVTVSKTLCTP